MAIDSEGNMSSAQGKKIPQKVIDGYKFNTNISKTQRNLYLDSRFLIINEAFDVFGNISRGSVAIYEKETSKTFLEKSELIEALEMYYAAKLGEVIKVTHIMNNGGDREEIVNVQVHYEEE